MSFLSCAGRTLHEISRYTEVAERSSRNILQVSPERIRAVNNQATVPQLFPLQCDRPATQDRRYDKTSSLQTIQPQQEMKTKNMTTLLLSNSINRSPLRPQFNPRLKQIMKNKSVS